VSRIRVYVSGATGNVGSQIVKAVVSSDDLELVGGWARKSGRDLGELVGLPPLGIQTSDDLETSLRDSAPDVVVDFTSASVIMENLKIYALLGLDAVIGTTGFDDEGLNQARRLAKERRLRWAVISNFSLSMNLVLDFIRRARFHYPYVTIVDKHYAQKADAPSGTAFLLARAASARTLGEVQSKELLSGALGGDIQGVRLFSERLPIPATCSEHEITLAKQDEVITIKVCEYSSAVYVDGVILAIRKIKKLSKGTLITELGELPEDA